MPIGSEAIPCAVDGCHQKEDCHNKTVWPLSPVKLLDQTWCGLSLHDWNLELRRSALNTTTTYITVLVKVKDTRLQKCLTPWKHAGQALRTNAPACCHFALDSQCQVDYCLLTTEIWETIPVIPASSNSGWAFWMQVLSHATYVSSNFPFWNVI